MTKNQKAILEALANGNRLIRIPTEGGDVWKVQTDVVDVVVKSRTAQSLVRHFWVVFVPTGRERPGKAAPMRHALTVRGKNALARERAR